MDKGASNEDGREMTLTYKIKEDGIEVMIVDDETMLDSVENEDTNNGKRESIEWSRKTINFLLSQYKENLGAFRNSHCKKKGIWQQIANKFSALGYTIKTEDLDRKFRNMKKTFMLIKNKKGDKPLKWEYFEQMDELLSQELIPDSADTAAVVSSEEAGVYDDYIGWNKTNILLLIELYKANMKKLQNSDMKKKDFWVLISEQFANHGYVISPEFIDRKYRNLKNTYRKIRDHPNLSDAVPPKWEYYAGMKEIDTDPPVDYGPIRFTFEDTQPEKTSNQHRIMKRRNRKLNCQCSILSRRNLAEFVKLRRVMNRQNVLLERNNKLLEQNNGTLNKFLAKLCPIKEEAADTEI